MPSTTSGPADPPSVCPSCDASLPSDASFCPDCGADVGGRSAHCPDCGDRFEPDDRFCSNCGASRPDADGESERAFRRRVRDHLDAGWEIERDDGDRVTVVDREIGSVGVHVLLLLFTGGVGNLLYGWWHYSKLAERRRLVRGDSTRVRAPSRSERSRRLGTVSAYLLSGLLLAVGGWIGFFAFEVASLPVALVGLAFALLGAGAAPPAQERLQRRHRVTAFGRLKTVDHRVVRPPESVDDPCVVCGEPFERGVVSRRRDETVVAGVPVRTHAVRHNHYCADCAREELFGGSAGEGPDLDAVGPGLDAPDTGSGDREHPTELSESADREGE
ncbi:zinc ribbon domain-containing protein [Halorubrum depositum]|uniref:zinc ribbon domain-containing protein n=1 Tax=Halorubrum depositum TaxID=2583992 RepID=UPI0011A9C3E3|nr:zinc ribbon domain-containing protein [Halorubrum depositum]